MIVIDSGLRLGTNTDASYLRMALSFNIDNLPP